MCDQHCCTLIPIKHTSQCVCLPNKNSYKCEYKNTVRATTCVGSVCFSLPSSPNKKINNSAIEMIVPAFRVCEFLKRALTKHSNICIQIIAVLLYMFCLVQNCWTYFRLIWNSLRTRSIVHNMQFELNFSRLIINFLSLLWIAAQIGIIVSVFEWKEGKKQVEYLWPNATVHCVCVWCNMCNICVKFTENSHTISHRYTTPFCNLLIRA